MDIRANVKQSLVEFLTLYAPSQAHWLYIAAVLLWIGLVWGIVHFIIHKIFAIYLKQSSLFNSQNLRSLFFKNKLFRNLALILQGWIVYWQASFWLTSSTLLFNAVLTGTELWMLVFGLLSFFSLVNSLHEALSARPSMARFPLKGVFQTIKLIALVLISITFIAIVMNKSPLILFSGLGALSAVLLLVFKDPILGLVSGIQLSANNMLAVGDWLEMPKYDADGDVLDISLTTVKVQNWDKTITTIPTYALISESFKNWRGMSESGGRRIKRSVLLNTQSVRFLNEEDLNRLNKAQLLSSYLSEKIAEVQTQNDSTNADLSSLVNGRRLTNIGTFRAYLLEYLKAHPHIHQKMTLLVRQLEQSDKGVPIQVYCFTNITAWGEYEDIQSDLFDRKRPTNHTLANLNTPGHQLV